MDITTLITIGPYVLILIMLLVFGFSKKIKSIKWGSFSLEGRDQFTPEIPTPYIYDKDVIIYRSFLRLIIVDTGGILHDIRTRVRANGWEKREWEPYRDAAIRSHMTYTTRFLNDFYPATMKVSRIDLYEWNTKITPEIERDLRDMYNNMYQIFIESHKETKKRRQELYTNTCIGHKGEQCNNLVHAMDVFTEIYNIENRDTPKKCMCEAERALVEIQQKLFSHFLTLYKNNRQEN